MKKVIKVPEYFKDLPDNANLNSRDVAAIFGYKNHESITESYNKGRVPPPDQKCASGVSGFRHLYWKVITVREWIDNVNRNISK